MLGSAVSKFVIYVLTAVVGTTGIALFDGSPFTLKTAVTLGITALTAVAVWGSENTVTQPWAKYLVGLVGAVAQVVAAAWGDQHFDAFEIQAIILAALGFLAVGAAKNTGAPVDTADAAGGAL